MAVNTKPISEPKSEPVRQSAKKSFPKPKMSQKALLIEVIVVVVLVILGAVYFFARGNANNVLPVNELVKEARYHVLRPDDLAANYYLAQGGEKPLTNDHVILSMKVANGKQYILDTGRVDGWEITLLRSSNTDITPEKYNSSISIFETSEGASTALSPQYFWAYTNEDQQPDEILDESCKVGSECILFAYEDYNRVSGVTKMRYDVAFRYKNALVWVSAFGLDIETTPEHVLEAAEIIYQRLVEFGDNN